MKKVVLFPVLFLAIFAFESCQKVPSGNVGIKFYLLGGSKGVDHEELSPGRYWIGFNEELYLFPTFNQNKVWTNDQREDSPTDEDFNFQSKEGMHLTASVGIEYHVPAENVPVIFQKYKKGLDEITDKVLRNSVRDAFNMASSKRTAEEMYGEGKVNFMKDVSDISKQKASDRGIIIDDIFLIGNMGIPQTVTAALNRKIEATQKAEQRENELRQAKAEGAKKVAETEAEAKAILIAAKAKAEANEILNRSLTAKIIENKKIDKWNGILPQVSGASAIVNIK